MPSTQPLNATTLLLILVTITLLGVGQVLFKHASATLVFDQWRTYFSVPLASALAIYALATLAWLAVLARTPLSVAFPFYGLGFLLVPLLSVAFLGEPFRWSTIVGGVVIAIGIAVSCRAW